MEDPGEHTVILMEWGEQMAAALAPERLEIHIDRPLDAPAVTADGELTSAGARTVTLVPVGACLLYTSGSAADDNIRNRTKNTRTTVAERDTYPQCMTALMIGEADAVAADDAISAGLASNNTGDHLKIVDVPDTTWSYGIAVKSGQDELVGQIDAALRAMVKDGSWQKAAADMGKSIGYTPDASMNPPKATAKAPSSGASAASEK